jgi:hypothetical protein
MCANHRQSRGVVFNFKLRSNVASWLRLSKKSFERLGHV